MDIQPACPSLSADTIESFPVEPPVLYDDIQDEAITPSGHKDTVLTLSDPVLDCDCHVSVYIIARVTSDISPLMFIPNRWRAILSCATADA
jgi:hypothetical protein